MDIFRGYRTYRPQQEEDLGMQTVRGSGVFCLYASVQAQAYAHPALLQALDNQARLPCFPFARCPQQMLYLLAYRGINNLETFPYLLREKQAKRQDIPYEKASDPAPSHKALTLLSV